MSDDGDKTLDPTPHRKEQFRKEGRFPRARDATAIAAISGVIAALWGSRGAMGEALEHMFVRTVGDLGALERGDGAKILAVAIGVLTAIAVPAMIAAMLGGIVAGAAQSGFRFYPEVLTVKPERLNPIPKLQQLFSPTHAMFEVFLAILRVGIVGYVAYGALKDEVPALLALTGAPVDAISGQLISMVARLSVRVVGVMVLLAVLDYVHSRFTLGKQMKMSMRDLKEEMRQQDGDPKMKQRMRNRARQMLRKRMMSDVKKADVVVTNPTHIAVALRYTEKDVAPIVVAKGHDEVALQLRGIARKHGIPIVENRALARALDAEVKIGHPVPGVHFAAVAQVLAFVYRLRGRHKEALQGSARSVPH